MYSKQLIDCKNKIKSRHSLWICFSFLERREYICSVGFSVIEYHTHRCTQGVRGYKNNTPSPWKIFKKLLTKMQQDTKRLYRGLATQKHIMPSPQDLNPCALVITPKVHQLCNERSLISNFQKRK